MSAPRDTPKTYPARSISYPLLPIHVLPFLYVLLTVGSLGTSTSMTGYNTLPLTVDIVDVCWGVFICQPGMSKSLLKRGRPLSLQKQNWSSIFGFSCECGQIFQHKTAMRRCMTKHKNKDPYLGDTVHDQPPLKQRKLQRLSGILYRLLLQRTSIYIDI